MGHRYKDDIFGRRDHHQRFPDPSLCETVWKGSGRKEEKGETCGSRQELNYQYNLLYLPSGVVNQFVVYTMLMFG